jgi:2-C-methyl-D-erythritol 4-phosphate cytidylyltransferase
VAGPAFRSAVALVLAGGTGSRMGRPKQFIDLHGRPALYYSLRAFEDCSAIGKIYAVGDRDRIKDLVSRAGIKKFSGCADPGQARSLSARSGLLLCEEGPRTVVLIHDGSRCLVTPDLVGRVVAAANDAVDGVVPAVPVVDTIKVAENGSVSATLDRANLRAVQTPQAFRLEALRQVYAAPEERLRTATDDASLIEDAGGRVAVVAGERTNIKMTSPDDLVLAEAILAARGIAPDGERRRVLG